MRLPPHALQAVCAKCHALLSSAAVQQLFGSGPTVSLKGWFDAGIEPYYIDVELQPRDVPVPIIMQVPVLPPHEVFAALYSAGLCVRLPRPFQ
eukprot:15454712-Alexandrium_andersonii.AAC.1